MMNRIAILRRGWVCVVALLLTCGVGAEDKPINIGGIYPHRHTLGSLIASPDEMREFKFYPGVNAHWVRLISDSDATITATFIYE